jgi:Rod binding domain-containing protein
MSSGIVSTASLLGSAVVTGPKPSRTTEAAQQFESLLLAEMLKSAHESASNLGGSDLEGEDDDSEASTMLDVADQQFAQMLAKNGGIGLTRLITKGLEAGPSVP